MKLKKSAKPRPTKVRNLHCSMPGLPIIRKLYGWSVLHLAKRCRMQPRTVTKIEDEPHYNTWLGVTLLAFVDEMRVTPNDLLYLPSAERLHELAVAHYNRMADEVCQEFYQAEAAV